jgi:hypothetical protein
VAELERALERALCSAVLQYSVAMVCHQNRFSSVYDTVVQSFGPATVSPFSPIGKSSDGGRAGTLWLVAGFVFSVAS